MSGKEKMGRHVEIVILYYVMSFPRTRLGKTCFANFMIVGNKAVLVNLFRNRIHFQRLLKNLYTPVFTTQYTEIASMLMEKNKTPVKKNIYLYL